MRNAALLLAMLSLAACATRTVTHATTLGRYDATDAHAFHDRVRVALEILGYPVEEDNPQLGTMRVRAHESRSVLVIRLYRQGWIRIAPSGRGIVGLEDGALEVPREVRDEHEQLAIDLRATLARTALD